MKLFGKLTELTQLVLKLSGFTTTINPTATADRVLTLPDADDTLVGKATTDILTFKTLTAPQIDNPTGLDSTDVGLGNVDNTSDATKDAATATLTNKTLTTPQIDNPTGLDSTDVGLENVTNVDHAAALTTHEGLTSTHGVSGALVGTTDVQPISNKTFSALTLTIETDSTTTGSNAAAAASTDGTRYLTNGSLVSVDTLAGGAAGLMHIWSNKTGAAITITNDAGVNGFLTGTDLDLDLADDASIILEFDAVVSRWRIVGGAGSGGGGLAVEFKTTNFTAEASKHYYCADTVTAIQMPQILGNEQLAISPARGALWSNDGIVVTPFSGESIDSDPADEAYSLNLSSVSQVDFTGDLANTNWEKGDTISPTVGGSGGNGEINYITNPDAEIDAIGWNTYDDGASAVPIDGTGTAATNIDVVRQSGNKLRGDYSFKSQKLAGDVQGEGVSTDFTIDIADRSKLLKISFDYNTVSTVGTYADGDLAVYIYDVTNDVLITPSDNQLIGIDLADSVTGSRTIAWASTDSVSYRLIFHVTTTSTEAYDFYFDNVIVGPGSVATGAVITAWEQYLPSNTQGFGSITGNALQWRRVGESVEVRGEFTTGTATSSEAQIELPNSYTVDWKAATDTVRVGGLDQDATTNTNRHNALATDGDTFINFSQNNTGGDTPQLDIVGGTSVVANTTRQSLWFNVPVAEFSGSGTVNLMSDNVAAANVRSRWTLTNGAALAPSGVYDFDVATYNNGGFTNDGAGIITVAAAGFYRVTCQILYASAVMVSPGIVQLYKNNTTNIARTATSTGGNDGALMTIKWEGELASGDTLAIRQQQATSPTQEIGINDSWLAISRIADYSAGQPVGFGLATADTAGLLPPPTMMSNELATSLGYMTYAGGDNGLVITPNHGNVTAAWFIPKEMSDGRWSLSFNVFMTSVNNAQSGFSLSGVTGIGGHTQSCTTTGGGPAGVTTDYSRWTGNACSWDFNINTGDALSSGTVLLTGKPTWAY